MCVRVTFSKVLRVDLQNSSLDLLHHVSSVEITLSRDITGLNVVGVNLPRSLEAVIRT